MKLVLKILACLLVTSGAFADHHEADEAARPVSYIGFNTLKSDHKNQRIETFLAYIETITPIMESHGLTLDVYKVDHNSKPEMPVDFITFGTATDQQSFQAFFANPEFQAAFPTLVGIIDAHFVTFVDQPVVPEIVDGGYNQLSLGWLKETDDKTLRTVSELGDKITALGAGAGARKTHRATGLFASTGLTNDIAPAEAPSTISLWHMEAPHDFLDNDDVSRLNKQVAGFYKEFRSYWISRVE